MHSNGILGKKTSYANSQTPDLIILDLNLPGMSGLELLKKVKAYDQLKIIPIVVLTTSSKEEDIIEAYKNSVNAFLTKPINLNDFMEILKTIQDFWIKKAILPLNK